MIADGHPPAIAADAYAVWNVEPFLHEHATLIDRIAAGTIKDVARHGVSGVVADQDFVLQSIAALDVHGARRREQVIVSDTHHVNGRELAAPSLTVSRRQLEYARIPGAIRDDERVVVDEIQSVRTMQIGRRDLDDAGERHSCAGNLHVEHGDAVQVETGNRETAVVGRESDILGPANRRHRLTHAGGCGKVDFRSARLDVAHSSHEKNFAILSWMSRPTTFRISAGMNAYHMVSRREVANRSP